MTADQQINNIVLIDPTTVFSKLEEEQLKAWSNDNWEYDFATLIKAEIYNRSIIVGEKVKHNPIFPIFPNIENKDLVTLNQFIDAGYKIHTLARLEINRRRLVAIQAKYGLEKINKLGYGEYSFVIQSKKVGCAREYWLDIIEDSSKKSVAAIPARDYKHIEDICFDIINAY